MRERTVGRSGLVVGEIGLGTLTWGRDTNEEEAHGQMQALLDAGGNLIDTSPAFGHGAAEKLIGSLTQESFDRKQLVICSRAGFTQGPRGMRYGAGRGTITDSVAASLERMNTDYIDVLLLGAPDPLAPDEESALALSELVSSGSVRYIGLMGYPAWRAALIQQILVERHCPPLTVFENEYSLLARECESEQIPFAEHCGLGMFAASPLGRGVLTGKYRRSIPPTSRAASEHLSEFVQPYLQDRQRRIVEALARAADGLGRSLSDVALAWVLSQPTVSVALVGARTSAQFSSLLGFEETLPELVAAALEDVTS